MLRNIDFSSWQAVLSTLLGIGLVAFIGIGIRLLAMMTIQQRQQRMNRQINERLKVLIAAYKVLGGSFTGSLVVDPRHLRELRLSEGGEDEGREGTAGSTAGSDRARRIRDAVEAALSDILLLGTEEHVRLAERAARDLVAGREIRTAELVVSLRNFIRRALDLDPVPEGIDIPEQGPTRPAASGGGGRAKGEGGGQGGSGQGGRGGGGMGGGAGGLGLGIGAGAGAGAAAHAATATSGDATSGDPTEEEDETIDRLIGDYDPLDPMSRLT